MKIRHSDLKKYSRNNLFITSIPDEITLKLLKDNKNKVIILHKNETYCLAYINENQEISYSEPIPVITTHIEIGDEISQDDSLYLLAETDEIIGYLKPIDMMHCYEVVVAKQAAFINAILKTNENSCTVINEDEIVIQWSKGAEKLFSIQAKDIIGRPITSFFTEENLEILNTLHQGVSVQHKQHFARDNLIVLINSNPIWYEDKIIGAVVTEQDITSQVKLNNQLFQTSEKLFRLEEKMRKKDNSPDSFSFIRGNSSEINAVKKMVEKVSNSTAPVLIYGESGVGKELFAKAIHNLREKKDSPYIAINCGAISSSLFESEIFGYEKGAFSGADSRGKKGKAELAKDGTLFLDEIGDMPLEMQVKFLRLLQEKRFYRVGGTEEVKADFRVVAATNLKLKDLVVEDKFREDLYYRLNVVNIKVPALRQRPQDIIELTHYFLYESATRHHKAVPSISQNAMQLLLRHDWPGNVRELKNTVERLIIFSNDDEITFSDVQMALDGDLLHKESSFNNIGGSLEAQVQAAEREIIKNALEAADHNKAQCAKNLNITRATLYNKINKLNI